jgi:aminoglycoside 6'-N-acetyltransferase I
MPKGKIVRADATTLPAWAGLSYLMYKDTHSYTDMVHECEHYLRGNTVTGFLYFFDDDYVGFINVSIRPDFADSSVRAPMGFIETIFVREDYRRYGFGSELVRAAEQHCAANGCRQLSSDSVIENLGSQRFHTACGFKEKGRAVFYVKEI